MNQRWSAEMAGDDPKRDNEPEEKHPIDPPVSDEERYRLDILKPRSPHPSPDEGGGETPD